MKFWHILKTHWQKLPRPLIVVSGMLLLSAIYAVFGIWTVSLEGVTSDERAHIPSGYYALISQNFVVNLEHPPLLKMVAAIPFLWERFGYTPSVELLPNQWGEGQRMLFDNKQADPILFHTRSSVIITFALLFIVMGLLLSQFLPTGLTYVTMILIMFEPNLFAHSRYVTTDVAVAVTSLLSLLSLLLFFRNRSWKATFLTGLFLGLTLSVKFSGIITYAALLLLLLIWLLFRNATYQRKLWLLAKSTLIVLLPLLVLYGVYFYANYHTSPASLRDLVNTMEVSGSQKRSYTHMTEQALLRPIVSYLIGFQAVRERSANGPVGQFPQYLDGQWQEESGWWYYFPLAWVYKSSEATLLLGLAALITLGYLAYTRKKVSLLGVSLFALLVIQLGISMTSNLNIGIRHISVVLILFPVLGVSLLSLLPRRIHLSLLSLITALHLGSFALAYPNYLSYFNLFAGGGGNGYRHLIDSNIDWQNNLKPLIRWAEEQGISELYVDYWGSTPLDYYARTVKVHEWNAPKGKPNGFLAVTPMWMIHSVWVKSIGRESIDYSDLLKMTPIKNIGNGIFVYDLRTPNDNP